MEKTVLRNTFQPKFAAYRQLPVLEGKLIIALLTAYIQMQMCFTS